MQENAAKIRVKLGNIRVEYEGDPAFLKGDLTPMVSELIQLYRQNKDVIDAGRNARKRLAGGEASADPALRSTNEIAAALGSKTGSDLALAAAAHLALIRRKDTFSRPEILGEMKSASEFYKQTFSNNLTKALDTLVKSDRLKLVDKNVYTLSSKERAALESRLALQA